MKRFALILGAQIAAVSLWAAPAGAEFGFKEADIYFAERDGSPALQAGSHPYEVRTRLFFNTKPNAELGYEVPFEDTKDVVTQLPPGLVGKPDAVPDCPVPDFLAKPALRCIADTQIGVADVYINGEDPEDARRVAVFNLTPPPGSVARFGFRVLGIVPVILDAGLATSPPYRVVVRALNAPTVVPFYGIELRLWGFPADPAHDSERSGFECSKCAARGEPVPFITSPAACTGPVPTDFTMTSWEQPDAAVSTRALSHDGSNPKGFSGCSRLGYAPEIESVPTTDRAETGSGLEFTLRFDDEGIANPAGLAESQTKKAVVTLPEGITINPAIAEGLGVCTPADYEREQLHTPSGEGCPNSSKIGTVQVRSPLVDEPIDGSVFVAQQDDPATPEPGAENPFDSLVALYLVLRNEQLGVFVKQAMKVEPDPVTGQIVSTLDEIPQVPFNYFNFRFREGQRAPLVTPKACGAYTTEAKFYPWSDPDTPRTIRSTFEITKGIGGPCPPGGLPPFRPGLNAGTLSNAAGSFSPFNVRIFRSDGEQELTRFAIKLPPGLAGILAGIPKCPDAAIEAAQHRTGREELASPSCPPASQVGRSLAGAGAGSLPAYAPGGLYLAGPYEGAPISLASITAATVGPFDLGTVVVRFGFKVDPRTAEVFLDPIGSDPIPHILDGIVIHARDIRAYVDRPNFTFNPTSCDPTSTASTVWGSGLDFTSPHDDNPVVASSRFQAADCAALGLNPKLDLRLIGGIKRGAHPRFRAHLTMPPRGANIAKARVTLPSSAFLDQSHIRTVCTRVAFAQKACPPQSVYGYAKAVSPVLDAPLEGPVYLRSSENRLPDLVAAMRSREGIEIELVGRIDSLKGRIRNTFDIVPDAPVTSFTLTMQGGRKGLIINSRNLCRRPGRNRAVAEFDGHNGKVKDWRPVVRARCGGKKRRR